MKVKHTFLKKGKMLRVYTDGKYAYSMPIEDATKVANCVKDAVRATGPVSTVVNQVEEASETLQEGTGT